MRARRVDAAAPRSGASAGCIDLIPSGKSGLMGKLLLAETAAVLAYTAIGLISAFLLARAVVTLRRDGQSATATA